MIIYFAADHRGFDLKEKLKGFVREQGYEVVDVGNSVLDPKDDYPDFAYLAAKEIIKDSNNKGIFLCGSGAGMDIVANKVDGIRAVSANSKEQAIASRNDDNTNVLVLAADFVSEDRAKEITLSWLKTGFGDQEKYTRRLKKIVEIENNN